MALRQPSLKTVGDETENETASLVGRFEDGHAVDS